MTASPRIPEAARRWWILAAMGCALGIVLLDEVLGGAALCLGSLGAGLADSATVMLASRAVEGLGAATMISLSIAMTGIAFGDHERGEAIGRYGLIAAVLAAI